MTKKLKFILDITNYCGIINKLIATDTSANAVIAQSVERVIGNDEVGSSNLPNSSKTSKPLGFGVFFCKKPGREAAIDCFPPFLFAHQIR